MDNNEKINFDLESENLDGNLFMIKNHLTMLVHN
jgi:hypothetical protein